MYALQQQLTNQTAHHTTSICFCVVLAVRIETIEIATYDARLGGDEKLFEMIAEEGKWCHRLQCGGAAIYEEGARAFRCHKPNIQLL